ncbi:MAG: glycine--tRNA ligase subunit beta [candidate division WOR-3 bacterium]
MSDFLLEVGVEELPALEIYNIAEQFQKEFDDFLREKRIAHGGIRVFFTPRRIAVYIRDISRYQDVWETEVTGPPARVAFNQDGSPTKALLGFLESKGIGIENIYIEETKKGSYIKAKIKEGGKPTVDLLKEFITNLFSSLKLSKSMRWNGSGFKFLRPIRWLLCLMDESIVELEIAGIKASNISYGNRLKGNKEIFITHPSQYLEKLRENFVIADPDERKKLIVEKMESILKEYDYTWDRDEDLLNEVVNLVEYPGVILGSFEERYLELPEAVIITAMKQHQRYFAVRDKNGKLVNRFLSTINNTEDLRDNITPNHEKVLRARLEDAEFYMKEDLRIPLEERVEELKKVVYRENLGTIYDKLVRVEELLKEILPGYKDKVDEPLLRKALYLTKVDLTTLMIKDGKEFTKLEGVIGMEYALKQGKDKRLARIIYDHVLPRFPGDELPETLEGALISICDKIDTLLAFLKSGVEISASQDPFGLRRTLYAIFEIIKEKRIRFHIGRLVNKGAELLEMGSTDVGKFLNWLWVKLESYLEEKEGIRYDIVDCVVYANKGDIWDVMERARVLNRFYLESPEEFEKVVIGQKRANNILSGIENLPPLDVNLFEKEEERELHRVLVESEPKVKSAVLEEKYEEALNILRNLKPYIDEFFDEVFVMVEDEKLRNNRLALLLELRECFRHYGDFSKIVISST